VVKQSQQPRSAVMMDYTAIAIMLIGAGMVLCAAFAVDARLGLAAVGVCVVAVGYLLATRDGAAGG
jgi:hypothetical protein